MNIPSAAAAAYRASSGLPAAGADGASKAAASAPGGEFGTALRRAVEGAVDAAREGEAQSMRAIAGEGDLSTVVAAVTRAELALQTVVAVRDRVVAAYQDVMRMPI